MSFLGELQRRNVFRVALLYIVASWLILQVGELLFEMLGVPDWGLRLVFGLLLLGFPIVLVFTWIYEITPQGIKREKDIQRESSITHDTARKLDIAVIVTLLLVGVMVLVQFKLEPPAPAVKSAEQPGGAPPPTAQEDTPETSIAVLPFADMSEAGDQAYFADGIAEELLNLLARVEGLKVAARTSSFKFKGGDAGVAEIGRALKVNTVLEGSVRKAGNRVRITAQLIDVAQGFHLWSDSFDRELDDIFSVQDEIAGAIVDALKVELLGSHGEALSSLATNSVEAYDLYLLGRHHLHQRTTESLPRAIELFKQVIEKDPDYAPAWSGLADAYTLVYQYGNFDPVEGQARALEAAHRAVDLDPELAEAHASLGLASLGDDDEAAEAHLRRAIELNPGYSMAHMWLGVALLQDTRLDEALNSFMNAADVDPLHPVIAENIGDALSQAGRYQEAEAHLLGAIEFNPGFPILHVRMSTVTGDQGKLDESYWWAVRAQQAEPKSPYGLAERVFANLRLGRTESARHWLDQMERTVPNSPMLLFQKAIWLDAAGHYRELAEFAAAWQEPTIFGAFARLMQARAHALLGDDRAALAALQTIDPSGQPPFARPAIFAMLAYTYHKLNRREDAIEAAQAGLDDIGSSQAAGYAGNWWTYDRAMLLALLNRQDEALDALDAAYEQGWRYYHVFGWTPFMDQLIGSEPRYIAFKGKVLADIERMREAVEAREAETAAPGEA